MDSMRNLGLEGWHRLDKYDRATGKHLETCFKKNTITTAGRQLFLDIIIGTSTNRLTQANAHLYLFAGAGGSPVKTIAGATSAPDHGTNRQVSWQWQDNTVDTYAANRLEVRAGASPIFSDSTPNFGTKPTSQNWHYTYSVTISGPPSFNDGVGGYGGLHSMLRMLTGATTMPNDENVTFIRIRTDTGTVIGELKATSVSRSGQTAEWVWVVPAGSATGNWYNIEFYSLADDGHTIRRSDDGLGNKSAATERTYRYRLSV